MARRIIIERRETTFDEWGSRNVIGKSVACAGEYASNERDEIIAEVKRQLDAVELQAGGMDYPYSHDPEIVIRFE